MMHDNEENWAGSLAHHGGGVLNVQRFAEIDSTNAEALRQLKSLAEGEHCDHEPAHHQRHPAAPLPQE